VMHRSYRHSSYRFTTKQLRLTQMHGCIPLARKNYSRMRRFSGQIAESIRCDHRRRVVITGMGIVSPLGNTLRDAWGQVLGDRDENNCGVTTLEETLLSHQDLSPEQFDREWKIAKSLPCQVASPVRGLRETFLDRGDGIDWNPRTTARFVQMALLAGSEAMQQANLTNWLLHEDETNDATNERGMSHRDRFGVCVGSGMSAVREISTSWDTVSGGSIRRLSPHFIPRILANSASGRLSLEYGLRGPNLAPSTACAASAHAIGDAVQAIRNGSADLMLAGGAEASIEPLGLAGFCRLRALSTLFNDRPKEASRPFDAKRDGFVMGEGATVLVLEELEHARERIRRLNGGDDKTTTKILAEITGYAASGDAFHVTAPDEAGKGAERAMMMALEEDQRNFSFRPASVGYVNAHATSTPKGDQIEEDVVNRVLQSHQSNKSSSSCYMSSTKGLSGHLLGAAGSLEAAFTVMSLIDQKIPATLNLNQSRDHDKVGDDDDHSFFTHVAGTKAIRPEFDIEMAISNSFGFGGTNASLVFRKYKDTSTETT